jgi:hypothetical protein
MKIKFSPRKVNITKNPVFIVGEIPGRPTKENHLQKQYNVWTGNKGASLILRATNGKNNIYLTNVCNYYTEDMNDLIWLDGIGELLHDIEKYKPSKIICLGQLSYETMMASNQHNLIKFDHPSYIIRFKNKNKQSYINKIRKEL